MTATSPIPDPSHPAGSHLDRALIEETAKKSGLLWVRGPQGPARGPRGVHPQN